MGAGALILVLGTQGKQCAVTWSLLKIFYGIARSTVRLHGCLFNDQLIALNDNLNL